MPEEEEIIRKRAELDDLEVEMAQHELDLATLMAELQAFERRYLRIVGARVAAVDQLEAEIAVLRQATPKRLQGHDRRSQRRVEEAHTRARQSAAAIDMSMPADQPESFEPSAELKVLFRDLAKSIHPDLAECGDEVPRRTRLMAEANAAYQRGDVLRLDQILLEWQRAPEMVKGDGLGADLVRVIRKIAQARRRLGNIQDEVVCLTASDIFRLRAEVEQAQAEGFDLLADMAGELDDREAAARGRLAALR